MNITINAPMQEKPLPLLRADVKIFKGPDEPDGSPTYNCFDPVKAQYYKISWLEFTILQHLKSGMTLRQLTDEINNRTTLKITPEELQEFFEEAARTGLLALPRASDSLRDELKKRTMHPIIWVLFHYLYVRVPLLNPDGFLTRTLQYVRPLVSTPAITLYTILTFVGLFHLIDRFNEFLTTFPYFFNLQGIVIYAVAISCVKVVHEFSHAYVAKFYGLHVPTMGVAFIVLWPVLYTDVTDGWKLNKRSQRLAISFAGVASEVILAGISTLGWTLTQPGLLHSVFFIIASATWISTLVVNLNPAMRFDGYYLMCDISGIDNLQPRSFAYTRWQLRRWLLGIKIPPPEEGLSVRRRAFMFFYSIYTWIYRLILYTVIAIFVYYKFTKALGILLFAVEIAFFLAPPFVSEARQIIRLSPFLSWNRRSIISSIVFVSILFWFVVPLPHEEKFAAITIPIKDQTVYVPQEGRIEKLNFKIKDNVKSDQTLAVLSSQPLLIEIEQIHADINIIKAQMHVLSITPEDRSFLPGKAAELASAEAKLKSLVQKLHQLTLKSTFEGEIYEGDDTLRVNDYLEKNQVLGKIASLHNIQVLCFVPEAYFHDLSIGQKVSFRLDSNLEKYEGLVVDINPSRQPYLIYPALASINKGELPVTQGKEGKLHLVESYFPVHIQLQDPGYNLKIGQRGHIMFRGPWRSYMVDFIRYVESIYLRESGL